jgi:hypothetical protein
VVTNQLQVQIVGKGTITPNYSNAWLEVGRNYSVTATPGGGFVFSNWVIAGSAQGGQVISNATVQFTMASNLTLTANFKDTQLPVLSITNLAAGQRVTNGMFTVKGTASDNWQVASVYYQLNNDGWNLATGTTNWAAQLALVPGTNQVAAYALDNTGNRSLTNRHSFQYVVTNQLQVQIVGKGTITPNYSNAWLEVGRNYNVTATPGVGFVFSNWVIAGSAQGGQVISNATVQFTMASNLTLTANFRDTQLPVLSITNLVSGQRVSNEMFTVKGTASDNWQVTSVYYQLNNDGWNLATGTTNWAAQLVLVPGTNQVAAYAIDNTGNRSLTNRLSFQYVVTNQLQVQIVGKGTITPNYSNAWLEVGRNYSMTATPGVGFVFSNWVIAGSAQGGQVISNATVQFTMASNLTLTADFRDTSVPVLSITNLVSGQRVTNEMFTVKGTASDNWQVTSIFYQLNNDGWNLATGTTNWAAQLVLLPGKHGQPLLDQSRQFPVRGDESTASANRGQGNDHPQLQQCLAGGGTQLQRDGHARRGLCVQQLGRSDQL